MATGGTLADAYYPVVALYQAAVAVLVLGAGRVTWVRVAFAVVLAGTAGQVVHTWSIVSGGTGVPHAWLRGSDYAILVSLCFIASRYPAPLFGARGGRAAVMVWLGLLVTLPFVSRTMLAPSAPRFVVSERFVHDVWFLAALAILAFHTLPKAARLRDGPLRTQTWLIATGVGLGAARGFVLFTWRMRANVQVQGLSVLRDGDTLLYASWTLGAILVISVAGWLVKQAHRERSAAAIALAAGWSSAFGFGLIEVAHLRALPFAPLLPDEILTQAVRPLLLGLAFLRFDLFQVPLALRRVFVPATVALAGVTAFVLTVVTFDGRGIAVATLRPFPVLGALTLVTATAVWQRNTIRAILQAPASADTASARLARLVRYRLALEAQSAAGENTAHADVASLRRRFGVTRTEHEALVSVLAGQSRLTTEALVGIAPGTLVARRYRVVKELGAGGYGRALLARDETTARDVVLKEALRPWEAGAHERRASLLREAEAAARVAHENVAGVMGVTDDDGQVFVVRAFVQGKTLEEHVAANGPADWPLVAAVARDVAAGLAALHDAGVLHLDVKPSNVILRDDGRSVLIDLGSARSVQGLDAERTRSLAATGDPVSLRWAAPEQLFGGRLTPATDIHQLAGVVAFLATGKPPVPSAATDDVVRAVITGAPPAWSGTEPPAFVAAIAQGRSARPAERHKDASAFAAAVVEALQSR